MNILKKFNEQNIRPNNFDDPFKKEMVYAIHIHIYPKNNDISANVDFENNKTKGQQHFESTTLENIVIDIYNFIEAL